MPIPKRSRRDSNESEIIEALERAGASVVQLSIENVPDLLVGWGARRMVLMEVKTATGKLREGQQEWINRWNGNPVVVVRSIEEALSVLSTKE